MNDIYKKINMDFLCDSGLGYKTTGDKHLPSCFVIETAKFLQNCKCSECDVADHGLPESNPRSVGYCCSKLLGREEGYALVSTKVPVDFTGCLATYFFRTENNFLRSLPKENQIYKKFNKEYLNGSATPLPLCIEVRTAKFLTGRYKTSICYIRPPPVSYDENTFWTGEHHVDVDDERSFSLIRHPRKDELFGEPQNFLSAISNALFGSIDPAFIRDACDRLSCEEGDCGIEIIKKFCKEAKVRIFIHIKFVMKADATWDQDVLLFRWAEISCEDDSNPTVFLMQKDSTFQAVTWNN
uniref:Decapping nuclease n=1 Tax=Steinernema glaseri TaxID=37863 RepID=A0A1I7ZX90_9BILA